MENNNSFPWISSVGGKKYLGTMAGTTVLCIQYPARVTNYLVILLRLGDLYLREEIYGHEDRELLSFSDKL